MKRRKFLQMLGLAAAAPVIAKASQTLPESPVIMGIDLAKPGSDSTSLAIIDGNNGYFGEVPLRTACQYDGSIRIESKEDLRKRSRKAADAPDYILERWYREARRITEDVLTRDANKVLDEAKAKGITGLTVTTY